MHQGGADESFFRDSNPNSIVSKVFEKNVQLTEDNFPVMMENVVRDNKKNAFFYPLQGLLQFEKFHCQV